jgi:hypothetical protein
MGTVLGYGSLIVARPIQANFLGAGEDQNERREMKRKREKSHDQTLIFPSQMSPRDASMPGFSERWGDLSG